MFYYLSQHLLAWSVGTEWADRLSALRSSGTFPFAAPGSADRAGFELGAGPTVIGLLKQLRFGQEYMDKRKQAAHGRAPLEQEGNATMGGILIVWC